MTTTVAAIDLGASSGRVMVGHYSASGATLIEIHRFPNRPRQSHGRLRWDVRGLYRGAVTGLRMAHDRCGRLDAIGVDGWAVDYGLLDAEGALLADPISYRDARTEDTVDRVLTDLGAAELYAATGTQLQPFNTMFQLLARKDNIARSGARRALLVPDLIGYWLSGQAATELTNASTTQLLDPRTLSWSRELADRVGAPLDLFAPLKPPGQLLGQVHPELEIGEAQVITVPSHDTAAAVAGIPAEGEDFAYVCTGTWMLVGVELPAPVITETGRHANFTNEVGTDGTIRYLRNVTGLWLIQECARSWGDHVDLQALTASAADVPLLRSVIDVQEPGFAAPGGMPQRIAEAALTTSGVTMRTRPEILRCVLDSLALAIRGAVRDAASLSGQLIRRVHVVGGGVSNTLLCQLIADATELPVIAGPVEAAAWGNAMAQVRSLGAVRGSLADTRAVIRNAERPVAYQPRGTGAEWQRAEQFLAK